MRRALLLVLVLAMMRPPGIRPKSAQEDVSTPKETVEGDRRELGQAKAAWMISAQAAASDARPW
ncbi:hypothetical protein SMD20_46660 [Nonomuraea sp. LP-02]|uniref:hypothetical protein n=1 Tax=Nonomuraea sp. LP-02 TaxID=3097960 RepID=UPI002E31AEBD|nr:hypothetical protein [Nonomuraea sp. LP-02]MED7931772.1 hypothetical protein [Nonomuraea sp. LP-02]